MITPPEFLRPLLAAPVAVLGAGVSGRAVVALVERLGGVARVFDERDADGEADAFRPGGTADFKLVVFSPGFAPTHPWIVAARAAGCTCLGEIDFASVFWRGSVVAITGTNGKTTLTEFLTFALRSIKRDAIAVGNVGRAFCQAVVDRGGGAPDSVAVCEVSSFQAETLRHFRADATLWINLAEDHLERHATYESYFLAKWRLFERTIGGHVFAGTTVQRVAEHFGQTLPPGAAVDTLDQPGDVLLRGTVFAEYPQRENFIMAAAWWRAAGLREGALYAAAQAFRLGPHRLACVNELEGVRWWNDSKATNFHATEAALARFTGPVVLIAGGKSKGGDLAGFVHRIQGRVKVAFLIGETRHVLATLMGAADMPHHVCADLAEAVRLAAVAARAGDDVLLSPGFASLDQFRGYDDRGTQFERLVNNLGAAPVLE
jgi:UDP-N-acetylmuramoylalanine--D-glutamate ligase